MKSISPHVVEVLGHAGMDFVVADAEHAPFDRTALDLAMLGGRAAGVPVFVRLRDHAAATILDALDMGASGLLIPHVNDAREAEAVVRHAKFRGGERGFSPSGRWAGYGSVAGSEALKLGDAATIICQIESADAVENAAAIAAVPGVDGLFVGRGDLSMSMGVRAGSPELIAATDKVIDVARKAGKLAGLYVHDPAEIPGFAERGVGWFVVGSDQFFLRRGAAQVVSLVASLAEAPSDRSADS